MTIIEKEVTREKEDRKTVTTCDICSLPEPALPDDESIIDMKSGKNIETEYILVKVNKDTREKTEESFDSIDAAMNEVKNMDVKKYEIDRKMHFKVTWNVNMDICEHCISTLFGANKNIANSKGMATMSK